MAKDAPQPNVQIMPLTALEPAGYNPRTITTEALSGLKTSLKKFGLVQPIVWNKRSKRIVGGHQRVRALQEDGKTEAMVVVVDLDEKKEKLLNLTLNNPEIEGTFTADAMGLLAALGDDVDYAGLRLDALQATLEARTIVETPAGGLTDPDAVPEPPKVPVTKPGDLWLLGTYVTCPKCGKHTDVDLAKK